MKTMRKSKTFLCGLALLLVSFPALSVPRTAGADGAGGLDIVSGGQAHAVIAVDDSVYVREAVNEPGQVAIPGWKQEYGHGKIEVTDALSYSGEHSLHLNDDDAGSYGVVSEPAPVTAGETYTVTTMVYRESGTASAELYIRFSTQTKRASRSCVRPARARCYSGGRFR